MTWSRQGKPPGHADPDDPPLSYSSPYVMTGRAGDLEEGDVRVLEAGRLINQDGVPIQEPASRIEVVALDEFVTSTTTTVVAESTPLVEHLLGLYDQLAIQVVTDSVVIAGTSPMLSVDVYHSADGIHWLKKNTTHEILPFPLSTIDTTYVPIGYDNGALPSLAFVKLVVKITTIKTNNISAHINVRVTCNDARETEFAGQLAREYKREHKDLPKDYWLRPGVRAKKCNAEMKGTKNPDAGKIIKSGYYLHDGGGWLWHPPVRVPEYGGADSSPGNEAAQKDCIAMGMSKYWTRTAGKALRKGAASAEEALENEPAPMINQDC